jgi:hypothetical protein
MLSPPALVIVEKEETATARKSIACLSCPERNPRCRISCDASTAFVLPL